MRLSDRIDALCLLGDTLRQREHLEDVVNEAFINNPWFTPKNIHNALDAIANNFLNRDKIHRWLASYDLGNIRSKRIGLIPAGNVPLVGIHDIISVLVTGHHLLIKPSDKDKVLTNRLLEDLVKIEKEFANYIQVMEKLKGYDAVIATGSDNSARYFQSYFKHVPHIIRKNRNSVAVLDGNESQDDLSALGLDVFTYFGMGCRNVSKVYIPKGYDLNVLLEVLHEYNDQVIHHHKYFNNFEYNLALFLLNKTPFLNNGCIIITESESLHSRIACLHYEFYESKESLYEKLKAAEDSIQCIVSKIPIFDLEIIPFGKTQSPELWDYADGVDSIKFLLQC